MIVVPVEKRIDWKRPPIVLILIVVLNILVFAFYQSDDDRRINDAFDAFYNTELLDIEWQAFSAYVRKNNVPITLDKNNNDVILHMVLDDGFSRFVKENERYYINKKRAQEWRLARQAVELHSSTRSGAAFGLQPDNIQLIQLFSHQFLHADVMHILGNMVFLILTGFAVEAALGGLRFLVYYLVSGLGSGLLFALFATEGSGGLVGASGSISGVMAMYVVLFRAQRIQFFYWFFIFTGYFKAAAIIMLPFYIGFELYNYVTNSGSNVAYTAHIGGFITGAALVYATQSMRSKSIDEDYIEGIEEADPFSQELQKLYNLIAQCNFEQAWRVVTILKKSHPNQAVLIEIEYNLVRALYPMKIEPYLLHRMDKIGNSTQLIQAQLTFWIQLNETQKSTINFAKKSLLLENALELDGLKTAESIFDSIKSTPMKEIEIAVLAHRIASYCQSKKNGDKSSKYTLIAQQYTVEHNAELGAIS